MTRTNHTRWGRKAALKAVSAKNLIQPAHSTPTTTDQPSETDQEVFLDHADQLVGACELDHAARLCQDVLRINDHNTRALETLAIIELELGQIKVAHKLFQRCLQHSHPTPSPAVHLYLAQLANSPTEALQHFQAALAILRTKLDQINSPSPPPPPPSGPAVVHWSAEEAELRRSSSRALVGMTEIYLTDLCFEPGAEQKCLEYLALASSLDPTDPEPLQTLASVRLSQSELAAAKEALHLAWSLWRDKSPFPAEAEAPKDLEMEADQGEPRAAEETVEMTEPAVEPLGATGEVVVEEEDGLPPFDARVQWAKLALECEMYSSAIEVLQQCEAEDDSDGELQYLLAIAWHLLGTSRDTDSSLPETDAAGADQARVTVGEGLDRTECWIEARECLETCLQLHERLGEASGLDESILSHLNELRQELDQAGVYCKPAGDGEEEEVEGVDEDHEWEDASDVEMEN